jgi:hypothetical protein
MVVAGKLLKIWRLRLNIHRDSATRPWSPQTLTAVENLVESLSAIPEDEEIRIDADLSQSRIARFIRVATGEIVGEIDKLPPSDLSS